MTPHHLTLTDEEVVRSGYDTRFKMNPPLRSEADRQALVAALADGTIDCVATDHAPHHADEKALEFADAPFGVTGLETALPVLVDALLLPKHLSLTRLVEVLSTAPARLFGLPVRHARRGGAGRRGPLLDDEVDGRDAGRLPLEVPELAVDRADAEGPCRADLGRRTRGLVAGQAASRRRRHEGPDDEGASAGDRRAPPRREPPAAPESSGSSSSTRPLSTPRRGGPSSRRATDRLGDRSRPTRDPLEALPRLGEDVSLLMVDLELPLFGGRKVLELAKQRGVAGRRIVILSERPADDLHRSSRRKPASRSSTRPSRSSRTPS